MAPVAEDDNAREIATRGKCHVQRRQSMNSPWVKWVLGVAGLILLGAGAVRAVAAGGQSGIVILVITGAVLVLSPLVIDRLESISAGTSHIEFRFTRMITDVGAPKVAAVLQRTGISALAESYSFVHQELPDSRYHDARMFLQDLLVERSAAIAQAEKLDAREVRTLFKEGSVVMRVLAIGLMTGDTALADGATISSAIGEFRSKNEQYHALRLAEWCWPSLAKTYRQAIHIAVDHAISSGVIPAGSTRRPLADTVLSLPIT
jgi:uncharacterized protein (DUF1810 family)